MNKKERIQGAIYGSIIGDVIGSYNEFRTKSSRFPLRKINEKMLKRERNVFGHKFGHFTDDTSMSLITLDRLATDGDIIHSRIMKDFYNWMKLGYMSSTNECFDIGGQTARSIQRYAGMNFSDPIGTMYDGNGALMRIFPIGLMYHDYFDVFMKSRIANDLTHKESQLSFEMCRRFAYAISFAVQGKSKTEILDALMYSDYMMTDIKTSGFVVDTFEAVVHTFKKFDNIMDGIYYLANLGDDSDTCAAIYGALAGAFYGIKEVPHWMLESLAKKEQIKEIAEKFYDRTVKLSEEGDRGIQVQ